MPQIRPGKSKRDWLSFSTKLAQAGGHLAASLKGMGDPIESSSKLLEAISSLRSSDDDINQRAWNLWKSAIVLALARVAGKTPTKKAPSANEMRALGKELLKYSIEYASKNNEDLTIENIIHPSNMDLYIHIRSKILDVLDELSPLLKEEEIQKLFDIEFENAVLIAWGSDPGYYDLLNQWFSSPVYLIFQRKLQWQSHNKFITDMFYKYPIFGQEEKNITLSDLYVPLRSTFYKQDKQGFDQIHEHLSPTSREVRPVVDLMSEILAWLRTDQFMDVRDSIKIVSGGPGSGKSSFAKALSAEMLTEPGWRVLYIPLQLIPSTGSLEARIGEHLITARSNGFTENPLKWIDTNAAWKTLFIFDGLDELAIPGSAAEQVAEEFIWETQALLGNLNYGNKSRAKALALGRPDAAVRAQRRGKLRYADVLEVLSLLPLDPDEYGGSDELMADQRPRYWSNWVSASGEHPELPEALESEALEDLTAEPLLLYLLILSGYIGDKWPEAAGNRNVIYKRLFSIFYKRTWGEGPHPGSRNLEESDFDALMQALALAAWGDGGRIATQERFELAKKAHMSDAAIKRVADVGTGASLRNVALQFYTRPEGLDSQGYEFIHKSFGEYLVALAVVDDFIRWEAQYVVDEIDFSIEDFLRKLFSIMSNSVINMEIYHFIRREIQLRTLSDGGLLDRWCESLISLFNYVIRYGFPKGDHGALIARNWRDEARQQRHAELGVLALLSAVGATARVVVSRSTAALIDWPDEYSANQMISRLSQIGLGQSARVAKESLNNIWFRGQFFDTTDFFSANLSFSDFSSAHLIDSCARTSYLHRANMMGCFISICRFDSSTISESEFSKANMNDVCFIRCSMFDIVFREAHLREIDFSGATLKDCDFSGATLKDCDFSGAKLQMVNFSGATLQDVKFDMAEFHEVDLAEATLVNTSIENVRRIE